MNVIVGSILIQRIGQLQPTNLLFRPNRAVSIYPANHTLGFMIAHQAILVRPISNSRMIRSLTTSTHTHSETCISRHLLFAACDCVWKLPSPASASVAYYADFSIDKRRVFGAHLVPSVLVYDGRRSRFGNAIGRGRHRIPLSLYPYHAKYR